MNQIGMRSKVREQNFKLQLTLVNVNELKTRQDNYQKKKPFSFVIDEY